MGKRTAICFPLLLQVTFACPTICNCLFHIFGLSLLPNVVKETAMTMALTFELYQHRPQIAKPNFCALQWHHDRSPKVGRHPPTLQWHPAMAPCNGTQHWHHVHCTLQWHPGATSNPPKWFVALPPYWK